MQKTENRKIQIVKIENLKMANQKIENSMNQIPRSIEKWKFTNLKNRKIEN